MIADRTRTIALPTRAELPPCWVVLETDVPVTAETPVELVVVSDEPVEMLCAVIKQTKARRRITIAARLRAIVKDSIFSFRRV